MGAQAAVGQCEALRVDGAALSRVPWQCACQKLIVFTIAATSAGYIRSCRGRARGQTPPRICEPGAENSSNEHNGCLGRLPARIKCPPACFSRSHRRWISGHRRRPPRPQGSPRRVTRTGPGQFFVLPRASNLQDCPTRPGRTGSEPTTGRLHRRRVLGRPTRRRAHGKAYNRSRHSPALDA